MNRPDFRTVYGFDIAPHSGKSPGTAEIFDLGRVHINVSRGTGLTVRRGVRHIAEDRSKFLVISLQQHGYSYIRSESGEVLLNTGDIGIYQSNTPYERVYSDDWASLVAAISIDAQSSPFIADFATTPTRMEGRHGIGKVLASYLTGIGSEMAHLESHRAALEQGLLGLLESAIRMTPGSGEEQAPDFRKEATRRRIIQFVDDNVADEELTPNSIAEALFMSVRSVHNAFAGSGSTVSAVIKSRRLRSARMALADPLRAHLSVAQIAADCGFSNASYFAKAHKEVFGETPTEFRANQHTRTRIVF